MLITYHVVFLHTDPSTPTETFPIQIDGQKDPNNPCYQMTQDMELKFTFHRASEKKCSSFTCPASDFIWKYELQITTGMY